MAAQPPTLITAPSSVPRQNLGRTFRISHFWGRSEIEKDAKAPHGARHDAPAARYRARCRTRTDPRSGTAEPRGCPGAVLQLMEKHAAPRGPIRLSALIRRADRKFTHSAVMQMTPKDAQEPGS